MGKIKLRETGRFYFNIIKIIYSPTRTIMRLSEQPATLTLTFFMVLICSLVFNYSLILTGGAVLFYAKHIFSFFIMGSPEYISSREPGIFMVEGIMFSFLLWLACTILAFFMLCLFRTRTSFWKVLQALAWGLFPPLILLIIVCWLGNLIYMLALALCMFVWAPALAITHLGHVSNASILQRTIAYFVGYLALYTLWICTHAPLIELH